jgi:hypothetical protein
MRRTLHLLLGIAALWASVQTAVRNAPPAAQAAQIEISRSQFVEYTRALSEREGYFDTHNLISNETSYLHVVEDLRAKFPSGNVYLGVGPDQNFSYIVHARPALAIVVDIRRQNMLEHLLYKALFDLSASRAEFLARLFSSGPLAADTRASLRTLIAAVRKSPGSSARYRENLAAVRERLTGKFGLKLSEEDFERIEFVYRTLHEEGLDLRFSSIGRDNAANYPTFESLLLQTDRSGRLQGYLSTEDLFIWMKRFQAENRLLPVVGDFAGGHALRSIGDFLRRNGLQVGAFYTSNVEFYLFGDDSQWRRYVANLRALPVSPDAVFIRSYFGNYGSHPLTMPGHRSTTMLQRIDNFLKDESSGRLQSYGDVVFRE